MFGVEFTSDDRGMTGIGTMIIFIALVITAAIGATVVLNETSYLQQKAGDAGKKSVNQVTDGVQFMSVNGAVDSADNISKVKLNVFKSPGASDIDLSEATVSVRGPDGDTVLTHGVNATSTTFAVNALYDKDNSLPVINEQSDRAQIVVNLSDSYSVLKTLDSGESLHFTVTSQDGASVSYTASAPTALKNQSGASVGL